MDVHPLKHIALVFVALLFLGCGGDDPAPAGPTNEGPPQPSAATPQATIQGMLALAEAGKWKTYVETYYGEKHKMDKPEVQLAQVAAGLETVGSQLIESLRACAKETPTLSDDGTRATYSNGITLHKRDGKWGFHL